MVHAGPVLAMTNYDGFVPTERMLTPSTLAEMLNVSDRHLTDVRHEDGTFPAPVMLGTLPRWSPTAIRRWMDRGSEACCSGCTCMTRRGATPPSAAVNTTGAKKAKGAQRVH